MVYSQELPTLGFDPDPSGNSATELQEIETCRRIAVGEVFDADLYIQNVDRLLAWEIYIDFDPAYLEVVDRDVSLFQAANVGSSVYDISDRVPDTASPYRVAAADVSDPATPDSGSGVLARLSFRAKSSGTTAIGFTTRDIDNDGVRDIGPFLRDVDASPIADVDDDTFFDGEMHEPEIAIDTECTNPGTVSQPGEGDEVIGAVLLIALGIGVTGIVVVFGAIALIRWRRQTGTA